MKIISKIFIIIFLLFILSFSHVYAVDMFLNNALDSSGEIVLGEGNISIDNSIAALSNDESNENSTTLNPAPTVTHTSSSNNGLSISDIISIILISVCVVIIFLAIAILIRCK